MWDLPGPGIKPVSPTLAGRFLTTAPAGKSHRIALSLLVQNCEKYSTLILSVECLNNPQSHRLPKTSSKYTNKNPTQKELVQPMSLPLSDTLEENMLVLVLEKLTDIILIHTKVTSALSSSIIMILGWILQDPIITENSL